MTETYGTTCTHRSDEVHIGRKRFVEQNLRRVDDILTGADGYQSLTTVKAQVVELLRRAKLKLRKLSAKSFQLI